MHQSQNIIFEVDSNIFLKILEPEDATLVFDLVDNDREYLREWLPWVDANATIEETKSFIETTIEQRETNQGFQCGIWYKKQFAGIVGYHRIDWLNRSVEIGYWLAAKYQGKGIMTKSCKVLVDYAFFDYRLNRVQIRCATENYKSQAIIERLGFIQEGMIHQAEFLYDHYVDLYVNGMTADIWTNRSNTKEKSDNESMI